MQQTMRVIITGAPGTGKTSLIEYLQQTGLQCFNERARATIKEQLDLNTDLVPWKNVVDFSRLVQQRQLGDYHAAKPGVLNIYDRGLPDVLAYLHKQNHYVKDLEKTAREHLYFNKVFIAPPWPEIFAQDNERREDLIEMLAIHHALINTYETIGYTIVELPKVSIEERVALIKKELVL
jgi:predicted ATPase